MKKFLLLLHEDMEKMSALSPKDMQELAQDHMNWANQLAESGLLLDGDGLKERAVLISGTNSEVKEGPYLDTKEQVGGYYLLQAESMEVIIEIAKVCPCHIWGGTTEIRQIMEMEEYES